jgi:hypothetical protein
MAAPVDTIRRAAGTRASWDVGQRTKSKLTADAADDQMSYLHGRIEQQALERLAARILEHQHNPIDESQLIRRLRAALGS